MIKYDPMIKCDQCGEVKYPIDITKNQNGHICVNCENK